MPANDFTWLIDYTQYTHPQPDRPLHPEVQRMAEALETKLIAASKPRQGESDNDQSAKIVKSHHD